MTASVIDNFISLEEIAKIQQYYQGTVFLNKGYIEVDGQQTLQWENLNIDRWIWSEILDSKVKERFGSYTVSKGCGKFQRCHYPFGMHVDSKKRMSGNIDNTDEGYALLIPLSEGKNCCTVFWDEYFDSVDDLNELIVNFSNMSLEKVLNNGLDQKYELSCAWGDTSKSLVNHLKFDKAVEWKLGQAVTWNRNQLHASTDFNKHRPFKDCLTIFFE